MIELVVPRRRLAAAAILGSALILFAASMLVSVYEPPPLASVSDSALHGDVALFGAVVARVAAGEDYYSAMESELRPGRYPTASVFNWRTPIAYVVLAGVPTWMTLAGTGLVCAFLVVAVLPTIARNPSVLGTMLGSIAIACVLTPLLSPAGRLLTETWAGLLIGLSLAAYLRSAWVLGAAIGITALFVRELAAPYCIVCAILALSAGRRRELTVWVVGLFFFVVYFAAHVKQVWAHVRPDDLAHQTSWIQFGGLSFFLATLKTSGVLVSAPRVVLAAVTTLLAVSMWSPALLPQVRWTVLAYVAFFVVVGQPFNGYWGLIPAFAEALAIAHAPATFARLIGDLRLAGGSIGRVEGMSSG